MRRLYGMFGFGIAASPVEIALRTLFACFLLPGVLLVGCKADATAQTASPRAAAKAYLMAMSTGDAATLAAVSVGDDASLRALTSLARLNANYTRLNQLATERFGKPESVLSVVRARDHASEMVKEVDTAPESLRETSATIGTGIAKVELLKVDGQWKVDRARHVGPGDSTAGLAMSDAIGLAYQQVADGIAANRYATADAAKADLMGKTFRAVESQVAGPKAATTRPAAPSPATTTPTTTVPATTSPAASQP